MRLNCLQTLLTGLVLLPSLLWPAAGNAAEPLQRIVRIGYLSLNPPSGPARLGLPRVRPELAKLGYVEGRNLVFEVRHAGGDPARLAEAASELVDLKVDVIFAVTNPAAFAAKAATQAIPIVAWAAHAAVETGLVPSLRRPGGNPPAPRAWHRNSTASASKCSSSWCPG